MQTVNAQNEHDSTSCLASDSTSCLASIWHPLFGWVLIDNKTTESTQAYLDNLQASGIMCSVVLEPLELPKHFPIIKKWFGQ